MLLELTVSRRPRYVGGIGHVHYNKTQEKNIFFVPVIG